jgi:HEPN domain-containing protein
MDKAEELRQWFDIADKDIAIAEQAFNTMHPIPDEPICFHCQQAVEKHLKGFLVFHNIEPPKIHDLIRLLALCNDIDNGFSALQAKCSVLSRYGVMPRYPTELQIYADDVRIALQYAKDIKTFIEAKINPQTELV